MNRVIAHAGLKGAAPFTAELLGDERGFQGPPADQDAEVSSAALTLRALFRKPEQDLVTLINVFWPEKNFTGLLQEM